MAAAKDLRVEADKLREIAHTLWAGDQRLIVLLRVIELETEAKTLERDDELHYSPSMETDQKSIGVAATGRAALATREEVLDVAPRIYREYASEFSKLAREATSESQRDIYLKAAQMWQDAAKLFEFETSHFKSGRGQQKPAA
jgi:hypothetical protein